VKGGEKVSRWRVTFVVNIKKLAETAEEWDPVWKEGKGLPLGEWGAEIEGRLVKRLLEDYRPDILRVEELQEIE
jgi:hypothetical protein